MKDFFEFDTEEKRQGLLSRARNVALWAIQQYEIEWNGIRFIQLSDTITNKIETNHTDDYLLRIHSERLTKEEIYSEFVFLNELKRMDKITVPEMIISSNGSYVLEGVTEEGYRKPYVSMMRWVEGEHLSGELQDSQVFSMGAMMGRLHEASARITKLHSFVRPIWDTFSFRREVTKLERFYGRFLSIDSWRIYQKAIEKIINQMDGMPKNDQNYGLIHADLHSGNIVFNKDQPCPIDFGRCGFGYYLYDMAGALLELNPNHRMLFIEGYESIRKLDKDFPGDLECFFIMIMVENYCHHSSDSREIPGLINEQKYALAYINEYITDKSFIFKGIEPVEFDNHRKGIT